MIQTLKPVEYSAQRIVTTEQLAEFYECTTTQIKQNFNNNKEHFTEGKHFFKLEGDDLKVFKNRVENFDLVGKNANILYLWTKKGAARHCKMLGTEKAWDIFEQLEENYFNAKKPVPIAPILRPADVIDEIGFTRDSIKSVFGVRDGIALAQATSMVEEFFGRDLTPLKSLIPPAEHDVGILTPTAIGEQLGGISGKKVNEQLIAKGFQIKSGKDYVLTEEGKQYAELIPYKKNGHSGYQIRWNEKILEVLSEKSAS